MAYAGEMCMPAQPEPVTGAPQQYVQQPVQPQQYVQAAQPQQYVQAAQPQQVVYVHQQVPGSDECCPAIRPAPTVREDIHVLEKVLVFFNSVRMLALLIYFIGLSNGGSWIWFVFIEGPLISVIMGILVYTAVFGLRNPSQWTHRRNMYISVPVFDLGTLVPILMEAALNSDCYNYCSGQGLVRAGLYMAAISQIITTSMCLAYTCPPGQRDLKQTQQVVYVNGEARQIQPQVAVGMQPVQQQGQVIYGQPQAVQTQVIQPQPVQSQLVQPQVLQPQVVQPQIAMAQAPPPA